METKRLVTMMLLSFVIIFGWQLYVAKLYEKHPEWKRPGQASTQPATTGAATRATTSAATQAAGGATTQQAMATTTNAVATNAVATTQQQGAAALSQSPVHIVNAATQPSIITIGDGANYKLKTQLSTQGAGVESITVNDKSIKAPRGDEQYTFQTPNDLDDADKRAQTRSMATGWVTVNDIEVPTYAANWVVEKHDDHSASFVLDLGLVRVHKIYELSDANSAGKGYELIVRHVVENTSQASANVKIVFAGPTAPPRESERGPDIQVIGGYDDGYGRVQVEHHMVDEYSTKSPDRDITAKPDMKGILWAGQLSVYFDALVHPVPLASEGNTPYAKYIDKVFTYALNPESEPHLRMVAMTFTTKALPVDPGKSIELSNKTYFGPRWRAVLNDPYYASFPFGYDNTLVLTSGPCAVCTFQFLINGLVKLLAFFHFITRDWGLAIIGLVLLVRAILHPITKKSQVSMMQMGKLGPEMERLKQKYADDKDELNKQMMALYKDQGIGMYLGCLPMFLQMPIWIALWSALQSTFELRQSPFLYGLTWIKDLARPDNLIAWTPYHLPAWIPLFGGAVVSGFNLLPFLLAIVFFMQQKYMPQAPATTKEQETQQKMMKWMSVLLFPIIVYNGPSGLNLYILTSTTIGIWESKVIRRHIKEREEAEKAGKIIVDAPKSMKKKRGGDDDRGSGAKQKQGPKEPKTGFGGWIQQLQNKAEELRREADKRGGQK